MTIDELLREVYYRGIRLARFGDRIRCRYPPGAFTPELHAAMIEHKPELLRLLAAWDSVPVPAQPTPCQHAVFRDYGRGWQCVRCGCHVADLFDKFLRAGPAKAIEPAPRIQGRLADSPNKPESMREDGSCLRCGRHIWVELAAGGFV